ncbi:MAG: RluA family pseudouridine synthase [Tindallia sp. MSAO_Bac2]|nr:MAG: RluA family pseudouridine synthase [Tindallia sp. MSAO_Bac2]
MLLKEEQKYNRIVYHIEKEEDGLTLKTVLQKRWGISGRLMTRFKKEKGVEINGHWAPFHQKVKEKDRLILNMEENGCEFEAENLPVEVIYEDFDVLVVNKQPGMLTHPTMKIREGTLANAVMQYMSDNQERYKIRFVNRLDMDTSGAMILAKNAFAHQQLAEQLQSSMIKEYLVFVVGQFKEPYRKIEAAIYRPENIPDGKPPRRVVDKRGKMAVSHLKRQEVYSKASLLSVKIDTGRTHQIRVHMNYLGHPVIGDTFYEPEQTNRIERQALHAEAVTFIQPRTKEEITCRADMPEDLRCLRERLLQE